MNVKDRKETVLVTGISGSLGLRLLPQLSRWNVLGVDIVEPPTSDSLCFEQLDLGREPSCQRLVDLLHQTQASAVVHLACQTDQSQTVPMDERRMWQINVAGTARVMEAITEVNRTGGEITKFILPSNALAYGTGFSEPVTESSSLEGHTLPYAIHKRESDKVAQFRAYSLGPCSTYILRSHIHAGPGMQNHVIRALRGTPVGTGKRAAKMRQKGKRLPLLLPFGKNYYEKRLQFIHVDDVARLIAFILDKPEMEPKLAVLNVAGRGEPITIGQCAEIANARVFRLPGKAAYRAALKFWHYLGISGVPHRAAPYLLDSCIMDTGRLRAFLGRDYQEVIWYTVEDALRDTFAAAEQEQPEHSMAAAGS